MSHTQCVDYHDGRNKKPNKAPHVKGLLSWENDGPARRELRNVRRKRIRTNRISLCSAGSDAASYRNPLSVHGSRVFNQPRLYRISTGQSQVLHHRFFDALGDDVCVAECFGICVEPEVDAAVVAGDAHRKRTVFGNGHNRIRFDELGA